MAKLMAALKQMLNALASADAGEYLTQSEKFHYLNPNSGITLTPSVAPASPVSTRKRIALYLGSELPAEIINYVLQSCTRLEHDLVVLTFQPESEAQALISPYTDALASAKIDLRLEVLSGDTNTGLARYLRRSNGISFLACNEAGFLGRGLLSGAQSPEAFPVPVVLVATRSQAQNPGYGLSGKSATRTQVA